MKDHGKIYLLLLLVLIGIFVLLRLYHIFTESYVETVPLVIDGGVPKLKEEHYQLSLVMVGDALIHDGVYKDALKSDGSYQFFSQLSLIKPIIEQYDLAYYNQESILGGTKIGLSSYPRFNSPYEVGDAFVDAGFNLVSTANNHTLDRGSEAILNSIAYWKTKDDVLMSGTCDSFACREEIPTGEKNHISYAFLSYTTTTNGLVIPKGQEYLVNLYSEEQVRKDVLKVRDMVDVILVAIHWGNEYQDYPNADQRQIAKFLAELGVDVVIGTHPHVIEPVEWVDDTLVFYSLGNFISAQQGIDRLVGLLASVTISKVVKGEEVAIEVNPGNFELSYTSYDSHYRNFKIYPFTLLDSSILSSKKNIQEEKQALVASYGVENIWNS